MRYLILFFLIFSLHCYSTDMWIQDSTASITVNNIKTTNNEIYSNILVTGTWTDNLGYYGTYKCHGNSHKNSERLLLDGICEGINQNNEKLWYKIKRNSSTMEAGVGQSTYLEGTGKYKILKGISCNYGVRYLNNINFVKTKCKMPEKVKKILMK